MPSRSRDLLPKRGQKKTAAKKDAPKKDAPKKDDAPRRKPEETLPPDPHADQMDASTGMSGSTNPRQGQPY